MYRSIKAILHSKLTHPFDFPPRKQLVFIGKIEIFFQLFFFGSLQKHQGHASLLSGPVQLILKLVCLEFTVTVKFEAKRIEQLK